MDFQKEKKEFLAKKDKSRKGSIDVRIRKLVSKINSLDDFFTTSSCSGRVLLFSNPKSNKKNEVQYLFSSHKKIKYNEIKNILRAINAKIKLKNMKDDIWFRMGGAILHIASNNTDSARKLLNIARDIGFRRSGIISLGKNRVTMELVSTENIEAIVSKKGRLVIDEDYLKVLVKEGNAKLEKTWKKIDKLHRTLGIISVD